MISVETVPEVITDVQFSACPTDTPTKTDKFRVPALRNVLDVVPRYMQLVPDTDVIEYLQWARELRGLAPATLRVRSEVLFRLHTFLDMPLRKAEPGHLLRFEQLAIAGRSPETRRAYACHLRAFYRWMLSSNRIENDPAVLLTLPKIPKRSPRPIAEDDLSVAIAAARPKMRAMLTLAAYAGLRACEIAGLEWSDLQREPDGANYIHVRKGKGSKERTVEIGETVLQALRGYGIKRRGPVFLGRDGAQIKARSVSGGCNEHMRRFDIPATLHQLRHRYGTIGYQLSRDIRMVGEQMGHSSPITTAGYTRPSAEAAAAMVAAMDNMARARAAAALSYSKSMSELSSS